MDQIRKTSHSESALNIFRPIRLAGRKSFVCINILHECWLFSSFKKYIISYEKTAPSFKKICWSELFLFNYSLFALLKKKQLRLYIFLKSRFIEKNSSGFSEINISGFSEINISGFIEINSSGFIEKTSPDVLKKNSGFIEKNSSGFIDKKQLRIYLKKHLGRYF